MREFTINEKWRDLLPPKTEPAIQKLEEQMLADLTDEPIVWWRNPETFEAEILDGHHRYQIACKYGLDLKDHEKEFESEAEAEAWIYWNQLSKRNLSVEDRRMCLNAAVEAEKRKGVTVRDAVAAVANHSGVSEPTVYRAMQATKMGYENQSLGDEFDQSLPEENFDADQDEFAQGEADMGFVDEVEVAENKKPRQPRKVRTPSVDAQVKSVLRTYEALLSKMQGLRLDLLCDVLEPDYGSLHKDIERVRQAMPKPKRKFGR